MPKLLIFILFAATVALSGCSSVGDVTEVIPDALDETSLIYRPTIQQGNVVSQEQLNALRQGGVEETQAVSRADLDAFLKTEGVALVIDIGSGRGDDGVVMVDARQLPPQPLDAPVEVGLRLARILDEQHNFRIALDDDLVVALVAEADPGGAVGQRIGVHADRDVEGRAHP